MVFRSYLENIHFVVCTDYRTLRRTLKEKEGIERLARWRLRLLEFDLEIHWPGTHHQVPDAMSKLAREAVEEEPNSIDEDIQALAIQSVNKTNKVLVMFLSRDPALMPTGVGVIEAQSQDPYRRDVQKIVGIAPKWIFNKAGILYKKSSVNSSI